MLIYGDSLLRSDVSLPAVFMPTKQRDLTMYNPRAHQYFHPTGSRGVRLTQAPSILELPRLPDVSYFMIFFKCS